MLKPLIINSACFFDHSPGGECLRSFLGGMDRKEWSPIVYASDRTPQVGSIPPYAHITHEYVYIRYVAAAIRRLLLPDFTFLPGFEWQSWGINATRQILKDIIKGEWDDLLLQ